MTRPRTPLILTLFALAYLVTLYYTLTTIMSKAIIIPYWMYYTFFPLGLVLGTLAFTTSISVFRTTRRKKLLFTSILLSAFECIAFLTWTTQLLLRLV